MEINTKTTNQISRSQITLTSHMLRSLGLSFGLTGTRLINKTIQILTVRDLEIVVLEDIYKELSIYFPKIKPVQMRQYIAYALDHRDYKKAEENFEDIFGFEHDIFYFEPKVFMEEVANIIRLESI